MTDPTTPGSACGTEPTPPYTVTEARALGLNGWNTRCNRCGSYGAGWMRGERPGWGDYAACPPHEAEIEAEHVRHAEALRDLRPINYEQQPRAAVRAERGAMYR